MNAIDKMIASVTAAGSHFFDRSTMRFFKSRVLGAYESTNAGLVFVTSENGPDEIRRYTVRLWRGADKIEEIGSFQQYTSRNGAIRAMKRAATALNVNGVVS